MPSAVVVQVNCSCPSAGFGDFTTCVSPPLLLPFLSASYQSCSFAPASGAPLSSTFFSLIVTGLQLLISTPMGAMKSLSSDENESEERLLRYALPNAWHFPSVKTPAAVRLIAASPKVCGGSTARSWGLVGSLSGLAISP